MTPFETIVRVTAPNSLTNFSHGEANCEPIPVTLARARLHNPMLSDGDLWIISYDAEEAPTVGQQLQELQKQGVLTIEDRQTP